MAHALEENDGSQDIFRPGIVTSQAHADNQKLGVKKDINDINRLSCHYSVKSTLFMLVMGVC